MLQYDRIDVSEGIDIDRTSESKECMLCYYWYFKDVGYKFQPYVCTGCHALELDYELEAIKEKEKYRYKNLSEEEKDKKTISN